MAKATSNTTASLNKETIEINGGNDSIVIVNALGDIPGGRTLDMTGFTNGIKAGHIIIKLSTGVYAPMPVSGTSYDSLPASAEYAGVCRYSVSAADPRAAIVTMGQVNAAAMPYAITSDIKTYLPHIEFLYEDANS